MITTGLWLWLAAASGADWRLVAAYDASSISTADTHTSDYYWTAAPGMVASCGEAKQPDGLGVFEAEAVSSGLMPVLTLVLEHDGSANMALGPQDVRVALGVGDARILLQPMVDRRYLAFTVHGEHSDALQDDETARYQQVVRTQLAVETCLEHKTGRGWIGGDAARLRQAFLLNPAGALHDVSSDGVAASSARGDPSRRFFGGQLDPVPALMGPPDACLSLSSDIGLTPVATARGEGSLSLVATDIWGASLRPCSKVQLRGDIVPDAPDVMPLRLSGATGPWRAEAPAWQGIDIALHIDPGAGDADRRVRVVMSRLNQVAPGEDASNTAEPLYQGPLFVAPVSNDHASAEELAVVDLLARIPHTYPRVGYDDNPDQYTVLMIPNWQIVEALRRLERGGALDRPMVTSPTGVSDGVGIVLSHPELLFLQLRPQDGAAKWPNLAMSMRGRLTGEPFGYSVGMQEARSPIVLPQQHAPSWVQTSAAQRSREQGIFFVSLLLVGFATIMGLRRIRDLWTRVPRERASYWPGPGDMVLSESQTAQAQTAASATGGEGA